MPTSPPSPRPPGAGCGGGSLGAYSDSVGVEVIRRHVAQYIEQRDGGIACDYNNVILSGGASEAIKVGGAASRRAFQRRWVGGDSLCLL